MKPLKAGLIAGCVISAVVCLVGIILIPAGNSVISSTVKKEAVLEDGTTAYENWVSTGVAVYRQFWMFDLQNADEVLKGGIPVVRQKGPYTYRTRYLAKENITFYENHTVSFLLPSGAIFEPSMSEGEEDDTVTTLNLSVAAVYKLLNHILANIMIQGSGVSLFQKKTVKELLWGYQDKMLDMTLGVFYPYNGTYDGPYNVFTGKDDINKVSTIDSWNGLESLSYWDDPYCDMINGTDGSSFAPFLDKKELLYFFSSDICRSVAAEYSSTENLKGIKVYRYMLPEKTFASPTVNPDNMCFCTDPTITKNCSMAGVLDVLSCKGSPAFISLPHFLDGSPELLEVVHGLSPNREEHCTYLEVEPITGFTLNFAKRLQMNMFYGPSKDIKIMENITENTMFPILWLNETATLDEETAEMFKKELISKIDALNISKIVLITLGAVHFVGFLIGVLVIHFSTKGSVKA